jgi:hypothetical protein
MPDQTDFALSVSRQKMVSQSHSRSQFFVYMAALLLLINFAGFAPTYFLRAFFDTPALPVRTHVHGPLFTTWFVLFFMQTAWIRQRNVALHRRFGVAGGVLAFVMVTSGLVMLYFRAQEYQPTGDGDDLLRLADTATVVWANLALLTAFAVFTTLGILFRRRSEAHRRLMLLASLSMMPQAIGRIGNLPVLGGNGVLFALASLLFLLFALVLYDAIVRKRLHPVSVWGPPLFFASIVIFAVVVPDTYIGQSLILLINR